MKQLSYNPSKDFYNILGVTPDVDGKELKAMWYAKSKKYHPDNGYDKNETKMKEINNAYDVLKNPTSRKIYDRERATSMRTANTTHTPTTNSARTPTDVKHTPTTNSARTPTDVNKFICRWCRYFVQDFCETVCCGTVYCKGCIDGLNFFQRHPICCDKSNKFQHSSRYKSASKFIQSQIDALAPKCQYPSCKMNCPPTVEHSSVCRELNLTCIKCKGKAFCKIEPDKFEKCTACKGAKVLNGKEWTKCRKCRGAGQYETNKGSVVRCDACCGNGALKGLDWTICFKCEGKAAFTSNKKYSKGVWINCKSCILNDVHMGLLI